MFVFLMAFLIRAGWGTFRFVHTDDPWAPEFPDERQYWAMAVSLHAGVGLEDELGFRATRMPLYPALLSLVAGTDRGIVLAAVSQWLVGALAALLTAGAATALFDRRVGVLAGTLVALDPFLVFFSSLLLTETLFLSVVAAIWWILAPILRGGPSAWTRWAFVGLLAALAVFVRESSLGLVALTLAFVVVVRRLDRRVLAGVVIAGAIVILTLIPWAARNRSVIGQWCWLTTRGGISLYDGVHPGATGASDLGNIKQMPAVAGLSEVQWNRYFLRESLAAIKAEPGRVLRLAGVKLRRMWNPIPNVETYQSWLVRAVSAAWMLPLLACVVGGVVVLPMRNREGGLRTTLFLLLPAIYLSVLHSLFVGSVRYRLGAIPMLEILAAAALVAVADRVRQRRATREHALGK